MTLSNLETCNQLLQAPGDSCVDAKDEVVMFVLLHWIK
jgi:hypothetical protein